MKNQPPLSRLLLIIVLIIMTLILWLSSCASIQGLPSNKGNDSLLLILLEKDYEEGIYRYGFRYEIYIQELKKTIYIQPQEKYCRTVLKPGRYHITEFRIIRIRDGKVSSKEKIQLLLEMNAGEITIFPFKIIVKMLPGETDYHYVQQTNIEKITIRDKREIFNEIQEYRNFDQWEFKFKE
jgi:hypothetical protein